MDDDPLDAVAWAAWWLNDDDLAAEAAEVRRTTVVSERQPGGSSGTRGAGRSDPPGPPVQPADGRSPDRVGEAVDCAEAGRRLTALSPREVEVLGLVVEGLGDKAIAQRLHISGHTVHRHMSNILTKLEVPSRAGAAALAARHGLSLPRL